MFVMSRARNAAPFERFDAAHATCLSTVVKDVATRWCMQLGLIHCGVVLTPRERQVLVCLIQSLTEAKGADALNLRASSFHQVVVRFCRKFEGFAASADGALPSPGHSAGATFAI